MRLKKRCLTVFLTVLVVVGIGFLSRGHSIPDADFTYAIGDTIKTLDPARIAWNEDIRIAQALWEGLATYHPETTVAISGVALIPPRISDDGLVYTFELRPDACWSNGEAVIADDFVYGWRRAIEPGSAHVYSFLITDNIAGAKAYSQWRNQGVKILGLMRDLARGREISDEDQELIYALDHPGIRQDSPDWKLIAHDYRRDYLAQMDEQFDRVGLKALDERHFEVTLARPTSYFLDLTAFCTFFPIHKDSMEMLRVTDDPAVTDLTLWVFDPQWVKPDYHKNGYPGLVSNGAFKLTQWRFKQYMLFEKNPFYWDKDNVKSDTIIARIITEPSTSFLAYERGDLDWLSDISRLDFAPALVEKMKSRQRDDIHLQAAFGTYYYYFNCQKTLPDGSFNPFADTRVRMAFNLAVDKQAIVDKVKKTDNPVALNFVPPGSIAGYYCAPGPEYNPERAKELLAEAGYTQGKGLPTIEILYNKGYGHENVAEAIAVMWDEKLGVNVTIVGKELKSFDEDKTEHRFMVCRSSWYGDYGDPMTFLDMMVTGNGQNDAAFSHPEYDDLIRQANQCLDPGERMKILARAETLLIQEQMPLLPLYYYVNLQSYRPQVKGLYMNARDKHPFKYIYVEK
ncbi:MAG: peptide ABC transporter substrate-binding protein [Sedimentisphaerales bacterium]|nr:peptide ABC transporter substrate-binding protein [Sedimentisphaerales bacterium]